MHITEFFFIICDILCKLYALLWIHDISQYVVIKLIYFIPLRFLMDPINGNLKG